MFCRASCPSGISVFEGAEDFLADDFHDEIEHAFAHLQDDVADEAVGDDDVADALVDVAAFDVADELVLERAVAEQVVRFLGEVVPLVFLGADVHQADLRLVALENVLGEDAAHDAVLKQVLRLGMTLAPTSSRTDRPCSVGMTAAMPGRRTSLRKRRKQEPPATMAPVLPALTMASTLRCRKSCQQRLMELSGFLRKARTGDSSMVMTWRAVEDFEAVAHLVGQAEERLDLGLIADEDDVQFGVFLDRLDGAGTIGPGA